LYFLCARAGSPEVIGAVPAWDSPGGGEPLFHDDTEMLAYGPA
jgi:hypothetical protein